MDISSMLDSILKDPSILQTLGNKVNADPEEVKKAATLGVPTIIEALNRNANSSEKKEALAKALDDHKDDDIDDLTNFLNNVDPDDSQKMVGHILGQDKSKVENSISKSSGLGIGQVSGLLSMLAPILIGMLGKKKKEANVGVDGLSDLTGSLGGLLGKGGAGGLMGMATKILDQDGDGDFMDDLGGIFGGLFGKK
ncbi:MAG: DUF937 domain-containing protein [Clostridiaceae bacterium]